MLKKNLSNISKKSKMIAATAFVLGATAIGGGIVVSAAESTDDKKPMGELVSTIAKKFGLNASEVQTVVDEVMKTEREEREARQQEEFTKRIEEAISDGKLTQVQADLIVKKAEEMRTERENNRDNHKDLTQEERKKEMESKRAELDKWAEDNNISEDQLQFMRGGMGMGGHGGPEGMRDPRFGEQNER